MASELLRIIAVLEKANKSSGVRLIKDREVNEEKGHISYFDGRFTSLLALLDQAEKSSLIDEKEILETLAKMRRELIDLSGYMTDLYEFITVVIKRYITHLEKIKSPLLDEIND